MNTKVNMDVDTMIKVSQLVFQNETLKKENETLKNDFENLQSMLKGFENYDKLVNDNNNLKIELETLRNIHFEQKAAVEWCSSMSQPFQTVYQAVSIYRRSKIRELY